MTGIYHASKKQVIRVNLLQWGLSHDYVRRWAFECVSGESLGARAIKVL